MIAVCYFGYYSFKDPSLFNVFYFSTLFYESEYCQLKISSALVLFFLKVNFFYFLFSIYFIILFKILSAKILQLSTRVNTKTKIKGISKANAILAYKKCSF